MTDRAWVHPGTDSDCKQCWGEGFAVVPDGSYAAAELCSCVRTCPICEGSGMRRMGTKRTSPLKRCACMFATARLRRLRGVQVPSRHAQSTRLSFQPSSNAQTAALVRVSTWIQDFDPRGGNRGLVLHGDVGRGKTHLMVAMLRELAIHKGVSCRFVEFSHLLADVKSGFDRGEGPAALLEPLATVGVLGIDELGKGRNTEFEGTIVDELVSRRYNADLPILATTNYAPGVATGHAVGNAAAVDRSGRAVRPTLPDRVGDRVHSRLREMCDFLPILGQDWREVHRGRSSRRGGGRKPV